MPYSCCAHRQRTTSPDKPFGATAGCRSSFPINDSLYGEVQRHEQPDDSERIAHRRLREPACRERYCASRGREIVAIETARTSNGGGSVIDGKGLTLTPGLIDAHVHVGYPLQIDDLLGGKISPAEHAAAIFDTLGDALEQGFTALRDVAGLDGGVVAAVEKRGVRGRTNLVCRRRALPDGRPRSHGANVGAARYLGRTRYAPGSQRWHSSWTRPTQYAAQLARTSGGGRASSRCV